MQKTKTNNIITDIRSSQLTLTLRERNRSTIRRRLQQVLRKIGHRKRKIPFQQLGQKKIKDNHKMTWATANLAGVYTMKNGLPCRITRSIKSRAETASQAHNPTLGQLTSTPYLARPSMLPPWSSPPTKRHVSWPAIDNLTAPEPQPHPLWPQTSWKHSRPKQTKKWI